MALKGTKDGVYKRQHITKVTEWLSEASESTEPISVLLGKGHAELTNAFLAVTRRLQIGKSKFDIFAYYDELFEVMPQVDDKRSYALRYLGTLSDIAWSTAKSTEVPKLEARIDGIVLKPGDVYRYDTCIRFTGHQSGGVKQLTSLTAIKAYTYYNNVPKVRYYVDCHSFIGKSEQEFLDYLKTNDGEMIRDWAIREDEAPTKH